MTKLAILLDQIDSGTLLLPEFQRGYVWNREQVRGLMRSLYLEYPVGTLLVWETQTSVDDPSVRGAAPGSSGTKRLLLDGQQRITSLYGVMRGKSPAFFSGHPKAFTGLCFHVENEEFEFWEPIKGKDPYWIQLTQLYTEGIEAVLRPLKQVDGILAFMARLQKLENIGNRYFHVEEMSDPDLSGAAVVEIFNKVNSGGTKLSSGDLALATIAAAWPQARTVMAGHLERWGQDGYDRFDLDWLMRNVNAVATGRAPFAALDSVSTARFQEALEETVGHIDTFLGAISRRLGLDYGRVLLGHYAFPVVCRFLHLNGGGFADDSERDRMLFWYLHSGMWGRFAGSTETFLARDYDTVQSGGVDGLIRELERWRGGNLTLGPEDFAGSTLGSRFFPIVYLLARVSEIRDLSTGRPLSPYAEVDYVFPKTTIASYGRNETNAIANYWFGDAIPAGWTAESLLVNATPAARCSQWIPEDVRLWQPGRYLDFLAARRELLAPAANAFLTELRTGKAAGTVALARTSVRDEVDPAISDLADRLEEMGLNPPIPQTELSGIGGLPVADAYWPDGLKTGADDPVVLIFDLDADTRQNLDWVGYRAFTSVDAVLAHGWRLTGEE